MLVLAVSGRIQEENMGDHTIIWISFSKSNQWWVDKQSQWQWRDEGKKKKEVKKSRKISSKEKTTHPTKALFLSVTSYIRK